MMSQTDFICEKIMEYLNSVELAATTNMVSKFIGTYHLLALECLKKLEVEGKVIEYKSGNIIFWLPKDRAKKLEEMSKEETIINERDLFEYQIQKTIGIRKRFPKRVYGREIDKNIIKYLSSLKFAANRTMIVKNAGGATYESIWNHLQRISKKIITSYKIGGQELRILTSRIERLKEI